MTMGSHKSGPDVYVKGIPGLRGQQQDGAPPLNYLPPPREQVGGWLKENILSPVGMYL